MRAIFFDGGKPSFRPDYPAPEPSGLNDALVRVSLAGICATDLEIIKGYMGFKGVPGHEFTGRVVRSNDSALTGRRVAGEINIGCGKCGLCIAGRQNHCPERSVLGILNKDGAFADFLTLPSRNLHVIPDAVSDEEAVFVEPVAAAFEITRQADITPDKRVCVLGDGRLGLIIAQVLSLTGCRLEVSGRHGEKLAMLGARGIRTRTGLEGVGRVFDVVVDSTGTREGFNEALDILRPEGMLVLKTTAAGEGGAPPDLNRVVIDEITVVGSRCGPFKPAIEALKKRTVDVRSLVERVFPIEDGVRALELAGKKGVLKVLLKMDNRV